MFYHVSEFVTMVILDPYGMNFDAVGVFGLAFHLLFKSCSTYCGWGIQKRPKHPYVV